MVTILFEIVSKSIYDIKNLKKSIIKNKLIMINMYESNKGFIDSGANKNFFMSMSKTEKIYYFASSNLHQLYSSKSNLKTT